MSINHEGNKKPQKIRPHERAWNGHPPKRMPSLLLPRLLTLTIIAPILRALISLINQSDTSPSLPPPRKNSLSPEKDRDKGKMPAPRSSSYASARFIVGRDPDTQ